MQPCPARVLKMSTGSVKSNRGMAVSFILHLELGLTRNGESWFNSWLNSSSPWLLTNRQDITLLCLLYIKTFQRNATAVSLCRGSTCTRFSVVFQRNATAFHKGLKGCYSSLWFDLACYSHCLLQNLLKRLLVFI